MKVTGLSIANGFDTNYSSGINSNNTNTNSVGGTITTTIGNVGGSGGRISTAPAAPVRIENSNLEIKFNNASSLYNGTSSGATSAAYTMNNMNNNNFQSNANAVNENSNLNNDEDLIGGASEFIKGLLFSPVLFIQVHLITKIKCQFINFKTVTQI